MISTLITLPYKAARLPLDLVDKTLAGRLPEESAPRVALDRTIGSADKFAGAVLRNGAMAQEGIDRLERSSKLVTAARLERQAEARREAARDTAVSGSREAADKREAAQDRVVSGLDEADATEARGKQKAQAEAAKTAAAKKSAADQRAADRTATVERRKQGVDSAAEAKQKVAQRKAKDQLDDARDKKQSAAESRADADRLSTLTENKKKQRKNN